MSETLEKILEIPEGVNVLVSGKTVTVSAQGKENVRTIKSKNVDVEKKDNKIILHAKRKRKNIGAELGTTASHISNMIQGVLKGYEYKLEIVYSHFPMSVNVKGKTVEIANLSGMKDVRHANIMGSTEVQVKGKEIIVKGHNKEDVGQTSANLEQASRVKGRDIRIFQDGIYNTSKGIASKEE